MKDCQLEILNQDTLNNKLMLEHQEPITDNRIMSFEELRELINSRHA